MNTQDKFPQGKYRFNLVKQETSFGHEQPNGAAAEQFVENLAVDSRELFELPEAAKLINAHLTTEALRKRLKRQGANVIQFVPRGKIYLTQELIDEFVARGKRRLRRS